MVSLAETQTLMTCPTVTALLFAGSVGMAHDSLLPLRDKSLLPKDTRLKVSPAGTHQTSDLPPNSSDSCLLSCRLALLTHMDGALLICFREESTLSLSIGISLYLSPQDLISNSRWEVLLPV